MFAIYQITDRREPILGEFTELRADIEKSYLADCNKKAFDQLIAELKQRWPVTIKTVPETIITPQSQK